MVSRERFVKALLELKSVINQNDFTILCNHSSLYEGPNIEVTISSFNEKISDDMWDIDMMWSEESFSIYSTLAFLSDDRFTEWFSFEENMSEIIGHPKIERIIKEWIVLNLDLFI